MNKEIVVSGYDKDINWVNKLNPDIKKTVYRKGEIKSYENEIIISNSGRDVHTFFYHILNNYDKLSDITYFSQDYPFDHFENIIDVINLDLQETEAKIKFDGYYGFHHNTIGTMWRLDDGNQFAGKILLCTSNGYPQDMDHNINVDEYWDFLFDCEKPKNYEFIPGGHFAITKNQIQKRPKEFYLKIVEVLEKDLKAPWHIERLELYIFNEKFKIKG